MIVIFIDNIEDFIAFLDRRILNEVFYEFKEKTSSYLSSEAKIEVVLHFLAMAGETLVLYETEQNITRNKNLNDEEKIITMLSKTLHQVDSSLKLIKGKIREVFLSYSS